MAAARHREVEAPDEKFPKRVLVLGTDPSLASELEKGGWKADQVNVEEEGGVPRRGGYGRERQ